MGRCLLDKWLGFYVKFNLFNRAKLNLAPSWHKISTLKPIWQKSPNQFNAYHKMVKIPSSKSVIIACTDVLYHQVSTKAVFVLCFCGWLGQFLRTLMCKNKKVMDCL